jgi:nucleotide-binding universal stress UspA family protein
MSFAAVLVHIADEAHSDARLQLAAQVADRFNARLIGFAAEEQRPLFVTDGFIADGEIAEREYHEIVERLARTEAYFRHRVGGAKQLPEWRAVVGNALSAIAEEMRAADLAILGQSTSAADYFRSLDAPAAVLRLGRPALVVPQGIEKLEGRSVVVGWKDTRECRRAVMDALPFLHEAASVFVVHVCTDEAIGEARAHVSDVVAYLARHRLNAHGEAVRQSKSTAAQELIGIAHANGADLLVTGAYGHSRFGEWVFGGVTHELLATSPICCLMAH